MTSHKRSHWMRVAVAIDKTQADRGRREGIELPLATWRQCEHQSRRIFKARQRGFDLAADRLQRDLQPVLRGLIQELHAVECSLDAPAPSPRTTLGDIYADLVSLPTEFETVSVDWQAKTLSVVTEPIELEGVRLGPFKIRLDWSRLADSETQRYRVIALDPNPATVNSDATHPHVQDETLCEGDGRHAIDSALKQVRLLDFFLIVANLLNTYNSSSPHVALVDWTSGNCGECGSTASGDDASCCTRCETTLCQTCCVTCPVCEGPICTECSVVCGRCDERHCDACMQPCSGCLNELCRDCLDLNERCSDCHVKETEETSKDLADAGSSR